MGLSNEAFAKRLDIGLRTVADWHRKPTTRPQSGMQETLDTALEQASPAVKARFAALTGDASEQDSATTDAEDRLSADPNISAALHWLDQHAGWEPGTARRDVAARLSLSTYDNSRTEVLGAVASTNVGSPRYSATTTATEPADTASTPLASP
jgi:hypothetical protein